MAPLANGGTVSGNVNDPSEVSIAGVLSQLEPTRAKVYQRLYESSGYEMGFGRRGDYPGHAHFHFCDLMFSPTGISTATHNDISIHGQLVVVPPRTYFADTRIGDFFFIKFCPDPGVIVVPDKTEVILSENQILAFENFATLKFDWFPSPSDNRKSLRVTLARDGLTVQFDDRETLRVIP